MATAQTPALPPSELNPNKFYNINREDCIGDSLVNINANANALAYRINQLRQPLNSTIIYVNASTSSVTYNGPGGSQSVSGYTAPGNGSPAAPFQTLQEALEAVYTKDVNLNGAVFIRLCPGSYDGCIISGNPVGVGILKTTTLTSLIQGRIYIQGSSTSNTFINQIKVLSDLYTHMYIDNANVVFDTVTFRYRHAGSSYQFVATAGAGTGSLTDYNFVRIDNGSRVDFLNTVFESMPSVLSTDSPQQTWGIYVRLFNFSTATFTNITISNTIVENFGTLGLAANARYFIKPNNSNVFMYGSCTLTSTQSPTHVGPRFSAFVEPANGSNFYQETGFTWSGSFGSRLGSGGGDRLFNQNPSSSGRDYLPGEAKNYIVKHDGPHGESKYVWTASIPLNSYGAAYATADLVTQFRLDSRRAS